MSRHKPKWLCVVCLRRVVPMRGCLCFRCAAALPWLGPR